MNKTALILGVSGQDGAYLAQLLLLKGYRVIGTSRNAEMNKFVNLDKLGIKSKITLTSLSLNDMPSILQVINKYEPNEIYNLAGQSSVGLSFRQPVKTMESISTSSLNLLEAVRSINKMIRVFNAGSSEAFGDTGNEPATEKSAFRPRSPYAVAKAASFWQFASYREAYNLFTCTGILFNHESPLRPQHFVTQKIIDGAKEIAAGNAGSLVLGNLEVIRDWGWAPEYIEAMWLMLQNEIPDDYVIASGTSYSLKQFVEGVFTLHGLDWEKYVIVDKSLFRPLDITASAANPEKARRLLGWHAKTTLDQIITKMTFDFV
jgi:GDPmannose 4,6-dehydratase